MTVIIDNLNAAVTAGNAAPKPQRLNVCAADTRLGEHQVRSAYVEEHWLTYLGPPPTARPPRRLSSRHTPKRRSARTHADSSASAPTGSRPIDRTPLRPGDVDPTLRPDALVRPALVPAAIRHPARAALVGIPTATRRTRDLWPVVARTPAVPSRPGESSPPDPRGVAGSESVSPQAGARPRFLGGDYPPWWCLGVVDDVVTL